MMDPNQKFGDCSTCGWKDRLDKVGFVMSPVTK